MIGNSRGRRVALLLVVGALVVTAGCTGGSGTKTYTGTAASSGDVHLQSAKVVDGTLRQVTIANNGSSAVPGGTWEIGLAGTSGGSGATFNTTVDVGSVPADSTQSVTIDKGKQPDWKDGAKLTIRAMSPGGTSTSIVIRPK